MEERWYFINRKMNRKEKPLLVLASSVYEAREVHFRLRPEESGTRPMVFPLKDGASELIIKHAMKRAGGLEFVRQGHLFLSHEDFWRRLKTDFRIKTV